MEPAAKRRVAHAARANHQIDKLAEPAEKEPLQVRIPVLVKRRFKSRAAMMGREPHELFVEVWAFYEAHHPADESTGT